MKAPVTSHREWRCSARSLVGPPSRLLLSLACLAVATSLSADTVENWHPLPKVSRRGASTAPAKGAEALITAQVAAGTATSSGPAPASAAAQPTPQPGVVLVNSVDAATPLSPPPPVQPASPADREKAAIVKEVGGRRLYSFRAEELELKSALSMFARANKLNIVPDREVTGLVTLDLEDLPLERVMQALLEAHDYFWVEQDGLIRVRAKMTQEFSIDYLRLTRKGTGMSSATLASGAGGGGGGGGGGGAGASSVNLTADNSISFWTELKAEVEKLLTADGKESMAINQTAGLLQITDRPSALKRVSSYLESITETIARQVEIQARIFDVTLKDQFQFGIDWEHAATTFGGGMATMIGAPSVIAPAGGVDVKNSAFSFLFKNENATVLLRALQEQGEVNVVSQPRIRVVNNQTAMIKVGTETPFFTRRSTYLPGSSAGTTTQVQEDDVTTITVGTILAITPQISGDDWVTLDIAPVLSSLVETKTSPSELTTAPVLDIKQASTLVRVKAGSTVVIGGLMQDERSKSTRKIPLLGDIPLLGKLFQGRVDAKSKKELVISITPVIVR